MSAAALPKPGSYRPPIIPPIVTTFDGTPQGDDRSWEDTLVTDVNGLLAKVDRTPSSHLNLLARLLEQRRKWLVEMLNAERVIEACTLPPLIFRVFESDCPFELESPEVTKLAALLTRLDQTILEVREKIETQNEGSTPSDH